jgi:hypothetical protein
MKRAHDAVSLCIRRERDTLSHRVDARDGPVMEPSMLSGFRDCWSIQLTSQMIHGFKSGTICPQIRRAPAARLHRPRHGLSERSSMELNVVSKRHPFEYRAFF